MFASLSSTIVRTGIGIVGDAIASALCLGAAAGPAVANESDAVRTARVEIEDLNLSTPQGRRVLDARVRQAARSVCATGGGTAKERAMESRCIRAAIDGTAPQRLAATINPLG